MSETPRHPTNIPDSVDKPEPRRPTHNIPPLLWVIVAILVAVIAYAATQRGGSHRTPSGGSTPQPQASTDYVAPAPATGGAPATPGGEVTGPAPSN